MEVESPARGVIAEDTASPDDSFSAPSVFSQPAALHESPVEALVPPVLAFSSDPPATASASFPCLPETTPVVSFQDSLPNSDALTTDYLGLFSLPDFDFLDMDPGVQQRSEHLISTSYNSVTAVPSPLFSAPPAADPKTESSCASVNMPSYVLHSHPDVHHLDFLQDPRFFFAGAPFFSKNDFVAILLQKANLEARRQGGCKITWLPIGSNAINRREELHFPDV